MTQGHWPTDWLFIPAVLFILKAPVDGVLSEWHYLNCYCADIVHLLKCTNSISIYFYFYCAFDNCHCRKAHKFTHTRVWNVGDNTLLHLGFITSKCRSVPTGNTGGTWLRESSCFLYPPSVTSRYEIIVPIILSIVIITLPPHNQPIWGLYLKI